MTVCVRTALHNNSNNTMANHYPPNAGALPPAHHHHHPGGMAPPPNVMQQQQQQPMAAQAASNLANPMAMFANYPLKDIGHPHPHDVLCGRGGATNNHIGNSHWRQLVSANKELYLKLPKRQKQLLSKSIVHAVRSQNPPGRFLQKHPQTDLWYDVGDNRALEKTSQALREGAPKLKEKLKKSPADAAAAAPESASVSSADRLQATTPPPPAVAATSESSVGGGSSGTHAKLTSLTAQTTASSLGVNSVGANSTTSSVATNTTARHNNLQPPNRNAMMAPQQHPQQQQQPYAGYPGSPSAMVAPTTNPLQQQQQLAANPYATAGMGHPNMYMGGPSMPPNIPPQGPVPDRKKKKPSSGAPPTVAEEQQYMHHQQQYSPQQQQQQQQYAEYNPMYGGGAGAGGMSQPLPQQPQQQPGAPQYHAAPEMNGPHDGGDGEGDMPAPPDGGLADHQGFSFGTVMSVDTQALAAAAGEPPMPIQPNEFSMGSLVLTDQELQLLTSAAADDGHQQQRPRPSLLQSKPNHTQQQQQQQQPNEQQQYPPNEEPPRHVTFNKTVDDEQQDVARGDDGQPLPPNQNGGDEMPAPVDLGLEPAGLSTGTMMSLGSMVSAVGKLENAGLSFGSVMSFSVGGAMEGMPSAVDGGLEEIGASFGSMTIGTNAGGAGAAGAMSHNKNAGPSAPAPMAAPPPAAWGTPALPTALDQQRSRGNLLECSDTESEDEQVSEKITAQKSSDWEKLKATFEQQMNNGAAPSGPPVLAQGPSYSSTTSNRQGTTLHIPTTNFARDVSQMSTMSAGDDDGLGDANYPQGQQQEQPAYFVMPRQTSAHSGKESFRDMPPPPPAAVQKQESDQWEDFEATLLKRGDSLAAEEFNQGPIPPQKKSGGSLLD